VRPTTTERCHGAASSCMRVGSAGQRVTLDATGIGLADQLIDLHRGDAVLILAYGRAYREVAATFAEASQLGLPTVLVTDSLDGKLARKAGVVIPAKRGRANRVALHGTTLVGKPSCLVLPPPMVSAQSMHYSAWMICVQRSMGCVSISGKPSIVELT
jgi:hypothetical protein